MMTFAKTAAILGCVVFVIPAEAGIQETYTPFPNFLDSRFRGNDAGKLYIPCWLRFKVKS